ncbi:MAG: caspase family protein [Cyanobacteria bacterium]|nr:caspase family protein [Cyanobacteriota bacterium]
MPILYQLPEDGSPKLHALIVGVGSYPHLENGSAQPAIDTAGLRQLTAPPVAARTLAQWLLNHRTTNILRPGIGSIDLLTSEEASMPLSVDGTAVDIEQATFSNVKRRFKEWFERCDAHVDNVALFYFCGHGIQKQNLYMLLSDFGEDHHNLFDSAADFHKTYRGMSKCKATTQLYFLDCCRQLTKAAMDRDINAPAFIDSFVRADDSRDAPIVYATAESSSAYALAGKTTTFAESIISGFSGLAAENLADGWAVTTNSLVRNIKKLMKRAMLTQGIDQRCNSGGDVFSGETILAVLPEAPEVMVSVRSEPESALPNARVFLRTEPAGADSFFRAPSPEPCSFTVPANVYFLGADFPPPQTAPQLKQLWVQPPYVDGVIKI